MRIYNQKLNNWPRIYKRNGGYCASFKVLTPQRFYFWQNIVLEPLRIVWGFTLALLFVDFFLRSAKIWTVFHYTQLEPKTVYTVMLIGFLVWHIEHFSRFTLSRIICGKRIRLFIQPDTITIRGLTWRRLTYERNELMMFSLSDLGQIQNEAYRCSTGFCIVIGDSRKIMLSEIFDLKLASCIVSNLNTVLAIDATDNDRDVPPY